MDEPFFGGARKRQRGRSARGKSIVFGLLKRDGRVLNQGGGVGLGPDPFDPIENYAHKGSVYSIDYQSLQRFGKPEPGFFHW